MNLIFADAEKFTIFDRKTVDDGEGGFETVLAPGAKFTGTLSREDEKLAKVAEAITQQIEYKLYTPKKIILKKGNIFQRDSDGKFFEVLFDNAEKGTPESSAMSFRYTSAREWNGSVNGA